MKILLAEDNKDIVELLLPYLSEYTVDVSINGEDALNKFYNKDYDLILLDVMMPILDGFSVCKEIRKESKIPIIIITARSSDEDFIFGIDIGADDYIVKPFSPARVVAKIKALLRRSDIGNKIIKLGNLYIDIENYIIKIEDNLINLTKKEIELLYLFAANKDQVFNRDRILDLIWGTDYFGDYRTIDSHIKRLRSKISKYNPDFNIKTVWGIGYKYEKNNE